MKILFCFITKHFKILLTTKMSRWLLPSRFSNFGSTKARNVFKTIRATQFWIFCVQTTLICKTKYLKLANKRLTNLHKKRQHANLWCIISHSFTTAKSVCCCACVTSHRFSNCKQSSRRCACSSSCRQQFPTI